MSAGGAQHRLRGESLLAAAGKTVRATMLSIVDGKRGDCPVGPTPAGNAARRVIAESNLPMLMVK